MAEDPRLRELRWKQPLREDEVALLADNILHEHPSVATRTLRAVVRLSLTPRSWYRVVANTQELLRRSAGFDEAIRGEIFEQAARIPAPAIRAALCHVLEESLPVPLRHRLLGALAREREPAIVPHLVRALCSAAHEERLDVARHLSGYKRVPHVALLERLFMERHWPTRFWLSLVLALDGTPEPLLAFFDERRPQEYMDWGSVVGTEDSVHFVLAERAKLLPDDIRRRIGLIPLRDTDPAKELQNSLAFPEHAFAYDSFDADSGEEPSGDEIMEATRIVERWIEVGPAWESDVDLLWYNPRMRRALSHVDPRLRGHAIAILFAHQFAQLRSNAPAFVHGLDGGVYMALTAGSILEGAQGIDVAEIFRLFMANEREPVYPQIQLATAATFASPREMLLAVRDAMQDADPEQRGVAASFVELACRYAGSPLPTWGSDDGIPDAKANVEVSEAEPTEVRLYDPRVEAPSSVTPGERVKIVVELVEAVGASGDVRLENVPAQWDTLLVDVSLVAPGLRFLPGRDAGVIVLQRGGTSSAFEAEGEAELSAGPVNIQVIALFSFRGRTGGRGSTSGSERRLRRTRARSLLSLLIPKLGSLRSACDSSARTAATVIRTSSSLRKN